MADSLGTLCIASAGGASTTVTLVASASNVRATYGNTKNIALSTAAVFCICRPYMYSNTDATTTGAIAIIAGGTSTAYCTISTSRLTTSASLNSFGTTLALGCWYLGGQMNNDAIWEYSAFA